MHDQQNIKFITHIQYDSSEPSDASVDRQGTLGIDPRASTNFALGPLSDRILSSGALAVNGQYTQCTRHMKFTKLYYY